MKAFANAMVIIILQYINVSNQHILNLHNVMSVISQSWKKYN